jgi:L-rhamnose-H+ transport protein
LHDNPFLGVIYHWVGGLAAASFYIPYLAVRKWAWETYWIVGGVFAWLIAPWVLSLILVPDTIHILSNAPVKNLGWAICFGAAWGIGGITYGLTMRYLGIALGAAVALGSCALFGTLMPPIVDATFGQILFRHSGQVILAGVVICLAGIVVSGMAGMSKERELTTAQKQQRIGEFRFTRGVCTGVLCGFMSAAMAYGFDAGKPISAIAKASLLNHGRTDCWQNLPVLIVILIGGFTTNVLWCVYQNIKNNTIGDYLRTCASEEIEGAAMTLSSHGSSVPPSSAVAAMACPSSTTTNAVPLVRNYLFCATAGITWYLQFFFYGIGTTKMGKYDFSSWTLHMASIIIFATLWGIGLNEWKGTSRRTHCLIAVGLAILIAATIVVGYGNYLNVEGHI